jgi:GNAT superfamily N-acetyltransferase
MGWIVGTDLEAYAERVLPWLERDAVRNTVPATLLVTRRAGTVTEPDPWLAHLEVDDAVAGAAVRLTDRGLVLSELPPGAAADLATVAEPRLAAVSGPPAAVTAFLGPYGRRTGARAHVRRRHRLHRLGDLVPPPAVRGRLEVLTDPELGADWSATFLAAVGEPTPPDRRAVTARVVAEGRMHVWVVDGGPVCLVGHSPTVGGTTRIGPVWTPPEHRRHGYAGAATAALAARLRPGRVVLFADPGDRTATGVYERLGFRPVGEWGEWRLEY